MPGIGIGISLVFRRGGGGGNFASSFVFRTIDLNTNTPVDLVVRDGSALVYYEGKLHLIGGWNPVDFAATNDSTNEHWVNSTPDDPSTWTQLSDAPFDGVHVFGCVVTGGFIWKFGNDFQNAGKTSYKYNEADGWVLVSAAMTGDWGDRYIAAHCYQGGYFYAAGGVDAIPPVTYLTSVVRSSDCVNWSTVGNLPAGDYSGCILVSDGSSLYLWGGGTYTSTGQSAILKSTDGGANWTNIGTLPVDMRGTLQDGVYFEGKFWHLQGFRDSANRFGLFYTTDFATWTQLYDNPKETHGSGFGVGNGKIYRVTGNFDNFMYSVDGIPTPENTIPTGAEAIYSVRNHPNFVGEYAMQVQRSSDNATLDIGFVGNDIDEAAMTTFMGAGNLFVSKWYDRSGNGNHATNVLGSRPRIGNGGVLDKLNGKVALNHTSESQLLVFDSPMNLGTTHFISAVFSVSGDKAFIGGTSNVYLFYRDASASYVNVGGAFVDDFATYPTSTQQIITDFRDNRIYSRFLNGQAINFSQSIGTNPNFIITNMGGDGGVGYGFVGYAQEVIIYGDDRLNEKAGIEQNINDYYSIY